MLSMSPPTGECVQPAAPNPRMEEYDVIKTLVSIEVDLPSSLAIRFACQLGGLMEMEIHPVYVKDAPPHESSMGAGWASRTWEKEMIETGRAEIAELIRPEMEFCPVLKEPRVIYGDRESELLRITQQEEFGFFVEGVHFPWTPQPLLKHLHTKLYQKLAAPLVLVRSLRKLNQVLLLCLDVRGTRTLTALFQKVWQKCSVPLVLGFSAENGQGSENDELREAVLVGQRLLTQAGCTVSAKGLLSQAPGADAEDILQDYGLVAVALERTINKDNEELQWLNRVKNAALLAFH